MPNDAGFPPTDAGSGPPRTPGEVDPLARLPQGAEQLQLLCARGYGDTVSQAFCNSATPPQITSLVELQRLLGLDTNDPDSTSFALTSHSSSLVTRFVSPINPRALVFTRPLSTRLQPTPQQLQPNPTFVAMGFVRGEQFVELVSKDTSANGELRFFLFRFEQACNSEPEGCLPGDLLTPTVESGFTDYTLYEDEDIANTILDCKQCHQPDGPGTQKILRMQERTPPWMHWLFDESEGNALLCADFHRAHPNEDYAGIPSANIGPGCRPPRPFRGGPVALEPFVEHNGFSAQPNEFVTDDIAPEVEASAPMQPDVNVPIGQSATWMGLYNNYLSGAVIPPPYHDFRITDVVKLQAMTDAYRDVMTGATPQDQLPDIRDVFLDEALPDMSMRPQPGSTGREILVQMCQQCHNSRLDQRQSRANFNVERLDEMSPAAKSTAIWRINLPDDDVLKMPPVRFRSLSDEEIRLVEQELMR